MSGTPTVPGERMPPLYFAGRDEELKKCDDDLRALCTSGESNGLQLTIGVPGSGKTRLADEFAKRVGGQAVEGRTVSTLMISPEELGDPLACSKRWAAQSTPSSKSPRSRRRTTEFPT